MANAPQIMQELLKIAGELFVENEKLRDEKMDLQAEIIHLRTELNKELWRREI